MIPKLIDYFKHIFFRHCQYSLLQWKEKSFVFVVGAVCIAALPALVFYYFLRSDFIYWANLDAYSPKIWITTSITLAFLSIAAMVAMARMIKGITQVLESSKETESRLEETTKQLYQRVKEHNQTTLSLKESEKRWHFALEGAGDGVWDWDVPGNKVFYSVKWKKMLGFNTEEITDSTEEWWGRIHPEDREHITGLLDQQVKQCIPCFKNRYRILCKNGSYKWILDRGRVMEWAKDGKPSRIIGTHADITMIKELEEQQTAYKLRLQQAQKMEAIGTLAGGIAHDFNNILVPILGHCEMLLFEAIQEDKDTKGLKQIQSSALRAKELVRQILTFSRQENIEYKPVKVQFLLKEVIKLLRSTIPKNIEIKQSIDPGCRSIFADAIQIHQIIMNLATNACHAIGENGGEVKINLNELQIGLEDSKHLDVRPGPALCLAVADTGTGMPPDLTKKIFDPFFTTKEKGQGTGMGLSVVHGIVESMKGSIKVYSEPGRGTEFKVYFPAEHNAMGGTGKRAIDEQIIGSTGDEHLLLVDDEQAILDIEQQTLERLGYRVDALCCPENALDRFSSAPGSYDLVITDVLMPGMSGNELAAKLMEIRPDVPIIFCTGFSDKMTPESIRRQGIRDIIMKPVHMRDLSTAIRKILDDKGSGFADEDNRNSGTGSTKRNTLMI